MIRTIYQTIHLYITSLLEIFARFRISKQIHQRLLAQFHQNRFSRHLLHSLLGASHYQYFARTSNGKGSREGTYIEHDRAQPTQKKFILIIQLARNFVQIRWHEVLLYLL